MGTRVCASSSAPWSRHVCLRAPTCATRFGRPGRRRDRANTDPSARFIVRGSRRADGAVCPDFCRQYSWQLFSRKLNGDGTRSIGALPRAFAAMAVVCSHKSADNWSSVWMNIEDLLAPRASRLR
jgi:hypothetical protein